MEVKTIKTESEYKSALKEIERLFDATPNTPDGELLDILITLVEVYEDEHCPIPLPDPIEVIFFYMESRELTRTDLEPYIGSRARVSEILNRKRPLTLSMIQRLHSELGIPAEILVQTYKISSSYKASYRTAVAA